MPVEISPAERAALGRSHPWQRTPSPSGPWTGTGTASTSSSGERPAARPEPGAVSRPARAPEASRARRARLQNGTTYNSYLIFGGDKTALVDVSHEKFRGLYMPALRRQLERAGRGLDYVFVSHTEPDHSGASLAEPR
jgi:hypothetical protein